MVHLHFILKLPVLQKRYFMNTSIYLGYFYISIRYQFHFIIHEINFIRKLDQDKTLFSGAPKSLQMVIAAMKLKDTCSLEESYDQPRQHFKKQRYYFSDKGSSKVNLINLKIHLSKLWFLQ